MRKVEVTPYNDQWPLMFKEEAEKLSTIFGQEVLEIHHIGSTSIQGLEAKPVIDIMPVVKNISVVDSCNRSMESIGYEAMGEYGIAGRRYFQKGGDNRTHHIHVFESGSRHIDRHLAFRDYLRAHQYVAKDYGTLKRNLMEQYPYDMESYIKGKEAFVMKTEKSALAWYNMQ
ncbi:GrpB family protein [Virgibacillus sp. L01]|uniref:GrpB family protein n=1 Tax=Virgibacillus sp. L01 TaxID=3457429 RepID=UPI003FD3B776